MQFVVSVMKLITNPSALICFGTPRTVLAIGHSLGRKGIRCDATVLQYSPVLACARAIKNVVTIGEVSTDRPAENDLRAAILQLGADMLIPCSDVALQMIIASYDSIQQLCHPGCPRPSVVDKVLDKTKTLSAGRRCRVPVPETWEIGATNTAKDLRYPLVAKPRFAGRSTPFKIRFIAGPDDLAEIVSVPGVAGNLLLQEYCPGEGVGIEMLMAAGNPLVTFQHRRVKEWPADGGAGVIVEAEPVDAVLASQAADLLREIGWEGVAMVEFRRDPKDGSSKLMEVNGRFWGSLPLAIRSGVDFPYQYWQYVHGKTIMPTAGIRLHTRVRWSAGDIRRLQEIIAQPRSSWRSIFREVLAFFGDWRFSYKSAYWTLSELRSAFVDSALAFRSLNFAIARRVIRPESRRRIGEFRTVSPDARVSYLTQWLRRALRLQHDSLPTSSHNWRTITFVCRGNRIRSPFAEKYFQKLAAERNISVAANSAGTHAQEGKFFDARACDVAREYGVAMNGFGAHTLTKEVISRTDAVFVMDYINEAEALTLTPWAKNVYLLGAAQTKDHLEPMVFPDPDKGTLADIRQAYDWVSRRVAFLVEYLSQQREIV
jgi:protein-tyrosine-phosphatase/predicted ATP-grasp superfamily ATP-dependent carboligase